MAETQFLIVFFRKIVETIYRESSFCTTPFKRKTCKYVYHKSSSLFGETLVISQVIQLQN